MAALRILVALVLFGALASSSPAPAQEPEKTPSLEEEAQQAEDGDDVPPAPAHKSGFERRPRFGSPNSPEGQLEDDDRIRDPVFRFPKSDRVMQPYFDWKRRLKEKHGLELGGHYVTVYQGVNETLAGEDKAWSGLLRVTGTWTLVGRGSETPGRLAFMVDHRHAFTDIAPTDLGGQAGYLGQTQVLLNDADAVMVNLNWSQGFNEGNAGLLVGRYDPTDYMNVLGYGNPWTTFANLAVLLDASVAFPDASWGIGGGTWFGGEQWYVLGTINDANGLVTDDLEFFSGGSELFTQVEVGWSPTKDDRYTKNVNLTYWQVDEREEAGIDPGDGVLLSTNWTFRNKWMPFFRAGLSEGTAPLYNESVTVGFIRAFRNVSDLLGVGVNWGDPSDETLRSQLTTEVFYRVQFSQNLAFTPSVQWLTDPALNPEEDRLLVLGLRLRVTY